MGGELGSNSGHGQVMHSLTVTLGHSLCNNQEKQNLMKTVPLVLHQKGFFVMKEYGA